MASELLLNFSDTNELTVRFDGEDSRPIAFQNPLPEAELGEVCWYLETYGTQYTADVDDDRANRLAVSLKKFGTRLFEAAFGERSGMRLFDRFLDEDEAGRLVTVQSVQPEILGLPWELLHQPGGAYVFNEKPRISVRRNLAGSRGGRGPKKFKPKEMLRVLMVVSRPTDAGFIDPRGDALAVLEAIDRYGADRIEVEFLRPGTLAGLTERLEQGGVDILHFDGHGVFEKSQNMGYLLFEKGDRTKDLVSAERLGELLNQQGLGLVVLSACQSSMYGEGEKTEEGRTKELAAIGSVAARLTQTGVQSVLAMSYSVLVKTTELLFGAFYGELVRGKGIGESLDNARRSLMQNLVRGERSRGQERIVMRLEDWFVPTLYQSGSDRGMVEIRSPLAPLGKGGTGVGSGVGDGFGNGSESGNENAGAIGSEVPLIKGDLGGSYLPQQPIAGFFGRRRELWAIERAFTPNLSDRRKETRRMTIAGFGGQGKTALAAEAGRWLVRSGMFEGVVFVDYAAFQGVDAVAVAVSTIARDLEMNLIDGAAVTGALGRRRTLVILDNLEDLQPEVGQALLTQAIVWSEAGQSRVLITTRQDDLGHSRYGRSGYEHQLIELKGLGTVAYPDDAIEYFQGLMAVPPIPSKLPVRKALIELFGKVDFHPLSIALVAEQLRTRGIVDVDRALDRLLAEVPEGQSKDRSLIASLNLSIDRLDAGAREIVGRLGVFEGGALESDLLAITEFAPEQWQPLRRQLESAGLVRSESLESVGVSVPFLKFHPTLARVLRMSLAAGALAELQQRHRARYYALAGWLYHEDNKNPYVVRAIVQRELPNLLVAVRGALAAGEEWAVDFVTTVNKFLGNFGMNVDRADLTQQAEKAAQSVAVGSQVWYMARSNGGERLLEAGQPQQAIGIFQEILVGLGETVSSQRCITLDNIGRCLSAQGQPKSASNFYRQALKELQQLPTSDWARRQESVWQTNLGDVLQHTGDYGAARQAYEGSLAIKLEIGGEESGVAVVNGQLGTLAMLEGNLKEAEERYQSALATFRTLNEPKMEAVAWHQLGIVYEKARAWEQAEQAYRAAAQLEEAQGSLAGAARTWNQLAIVCQLSGKSKEAEAWYRKAIDADRKVGNPIYLARHLNNLADLLKTQGNLPEARKLAEEALTILETLDPAAAQPWIICMTLATIATQQGEAAKAQDYRRLSRQSYKAFEGSQQILKQNEGFIQGVVVAITDAAVRQQLEEVLPQMPATVASAIQQILEGVRDENELCDELDFEKGAIIVEILSRL